MNAQNQGYQQYQYSYQGQQQANTQNKVGQSTNKRNRKPIHTAFFSNVPFTLSDEKFQEFVQSFGEISYIYSLTHTKGIAFVTYYDIRNAQKAVEEGNDKLLGGRPVKTNYANKSHFPHQDPTTTCSTILIKSTSSPSKMTIHEVIAKMKDFGDIHSASPVEGQPGTFVVKYYNIKDAHKAMEHNYQQIGPEAAILEFKLEDEDNPDIQTQPRNNYQMQQNNQAYGMAPNMGYQQQPNMQVPPQYQRMPQSQQSQQQQSQQPPQQQHYQQQSYYNQMPPPQYGVNPQQMPPGPLNMPPPPPPPQSSQSNPITAQKLKNLKMQLKKSNQ